MQFSLTSAARLSLVLVCSAFAPAQQPRDRKTESESPSHLQLKVVKSVQANEFAPNIAGLPACDEDGNVYILTDYDANAAIGKYNEKGERVALFRANSVTDLKIDFPFNYSVSPDGLVRQIMYVHESPNRWIVTFGKNGGYQSKIKLDPGFEITANQAVAFPSGQFIVTGTRRSSNPELDRSAFTGIFSSDGTLLRQVELSDDKSINEMWASGDSRVVSSPAAKTNSAISLGMLEVGADGNAYILRHLSPAKIYVVSPGGAVVRSFIVDPGEGKQSYVPIRMQMSHQRIAVLFYESQTRDLALDVVDLEGHQVAAYEDKTVGVKPLTLAISLVCFQDYPERYTFLSVSQDDRLEIRTVEPR